MCDSLRAGPKTIQVQLTNVNAETSTEDIAKYVENVGDKTVKAENVEDTSSDGWDTKRFLVTFKYELLQSVTNPELWPEGFIY